jgi:hypothetical protein
MTDLSFIDYWNAVDAALEKFFGLHSGAAGVAPYLIAIAQEEGDDPEQFALWFGEKYGLARLAESSL